MVQEPLPIHVLDKETAELIAAGEVVERPASIVKELLENAVDSGADAVSLEIKNGGVTFIRVTDNGCGIRREDVPTAFLRHATSKIARKDDLQSILTFGFRGRRWRRCRRFQRWSCSLGQKGSSPAPGTALREARPSAVRTRAVPRGPPSR